MNHSKRWKVILAPLIGLAAMVIALRSLHAMETQAADSAANKPYGVVQAQNGSTTRDWRIITVDDWGIAGLHTSLALEPVAPYNFHIGYYLGFPNYNLSYAFGDQVSWVTTTVDSQGIVGYDASLALAPAPPYTPHISYYDFSNGDLKYARRNGITSEWETEEVDSEENVGSYTSLALEPIPPYIPHISYYDVTNKHLKHAWRNGNTWMTETVDNGESVGSYTSLALEPAPSYIPHISYRDATNRSLKHAWLNSTGWLNETVDDTGSVGWYTSLALEPTAPYTPHISYFDRANNYNLKHAWLSGTTWLSETVDDAGSVGWYTSLVLEPTPPHTPHISYYDFTHGDLKHAWLSETEWLSEIVDSEGNVGRYSSVDLVAETTSSYNICISYYDDTNNVLKLACSQLGDGSEVYLPFIMKDFPSP